MTKALVIGAGPAGLSAALGLTEWCDSVTVTESQPRGRTRVAGEHLPPASLPELDRLGLSDLLEDERHDASPGVRSAWGSSDFVDKEYFMTVVGHGVNLRREVFDAALADRAEARGVELRFETRLERIRRDDDGFHARWTDGGGGGPESFDCVIDATGRRAAAARHLGATPTRCDSLVGLVGRIEGCTPIDEAGRVHVESTEAGWWYGVQFSDDVLLATLMTDPEVIRENPDRAHGLWREHLEQSTLLAPIAATGRWTGELTTFDAAAQRLDYDTASAFIAVGDAAVAYDPLSSWGITKALQDGSAGARALARHHDGDTESLARHRTQQRRGYDEHLSRRSELYRSETRWPSSPFWRSRRRESRTEE